MLRDAAQNPFIRLKESGDVADAICSEQQQASDAERDFNAASEREGISHAWQLVEGDPGDLLIYASRLQDLVLLGQCGEASELLYGPVIQVVLSGHPALVVPRSWTSPEPAKHAVVAWNGSAQASAVALRRCQALQRQALDCDIIHLCLNRSGAVRVDLEERRLELGPDPLLAADRGERPLARI